jgi:hypothetical protein
MPVQATIRGGLLFSREGLLEGKTRSIVAEARLEVDEQGSGERNLRLRFLKIKDRVCLYIGLLG